MAPTGSPAGGPSGPPEGALTFEADLRKRPGTRLGIDVVLVSSPHGCGLVVERVNEGGLVEAWNRRNRDPMRIRSGDFIIRVNGIEGEISALAKELRSGADVRITVQRSGGEDPPQTWKDLQASIMRKRPGAGGSSGQGMMETGVSSISSGPSAANFTGPVGMLDQQPRPTGTNSWGNPGFQYVGMSNHSQGNEASWGAAGQWSQNPWELGDSIDSRMPPSSRLAISTVDANQMVDPADSSSFVAPNANMQEQENTFTFEAALTKPDRARLGIDVMPHTVTDFCGLTVKRVSKGGVVDEWNQQCRDPRAQIMRGDRIVRVNGVTADFAQMWEELCTRRDLNVTVLRCNNQAAAFSQGQQAFGVGPVTLPGHGGRNMLQDAMRPAITDAVSLSRGIGAQTGSGPPAIVLPNHAALGRDGAQRIGAVPSSQGLGRNVSGNPSTAPSNLVGASGPNGSSSGLLGGFGLPSAPGPPPPPPPPLAPGSHSLGKGSAPGKGMPMPSFAGPDSRAPHVTPSPHATPSPAGLPSGPGNHSLIAGPSAANLSEDVIRFDVVLETAKNKRVGMDVILVSGSQLCGFVVERVSEGGRVDVWNKQSQPPYRVQAGDYIVQVNGIGNWQSLSKMAEEFVKESRQVCFTIQRGPPVMQDQKSLTQNPTRKPIEKQGKEMKRQDSVEDRIPTKALPVPFGIGLHANENASNNTISENARPETGPPLPLGLGRKTASVPGDGQNQPQAPIPFSNLAQAVKEMPPETPPPSSLAQESLQEVMVITDESKFSSASTLAAAIANLSSNNAEEEPPPKDAEVEAPPLEMQSSPSTKRDPPKAVAPPPGPPPGLPVPPQAGKISMSGDNDKGEQHGFTPTSRQPAAPSDPPSEAPPAPPQTSLHKPAPKISEVCPPPSTSPPPADTVVSSSDVASAESEIRSTGDIQSPSSADRELEINRDLPANGRRNNKATVTPIGAGRNVGKGTDSKAPSAGPETSTATEVKHRSDIVGKEPEKASKTAQSTVDRLRTKTLQLSDQDLSALLRCVLHQKPELRLSVSETLNATSSSS